MRLRWDQTQSRRFAFHGGLVWTCRLEKIFQTTSRDGCVWYNRRRAFYLYSFFLIHSLSQILKYREKREDRLIKLNCLMTLNNDRTKLSSTDRYESFGATVGDLCFVSRSITSIVGHILDLSSRNVSNVVTQWNSIDAIWLLSLIKCVIVHRDSERYC